MYEIALMICPVFGHQAKNFKNLLNACTKALEGEFTLDSTTIGWPAHVSNFLHCTECNLMDERSTNDKKNSVIENSKCDVGNQNGPCRYSTEPNHSSLLQLLTCIFKNEPPEAYQILWCHQNVSSRELLTFIKRSRLKPFQQFALVQVELLGKSQHLGLGLSF